MGARSASSVTSLRFINPSTPGAADSGNLIWSSQASLPGVPWNEGIPISQGDHVRSVYSPSRKICESFDAHSHWTTIQSLSAWKYLVCSRKPCNTLNYSIHRRAGSKDCSQEKASHGWGLFPLNLWDDRIRLQTSQIRWFIQAHSIPTISLFMLSSSSNASTLSIWRLNWSWPPAVYYRREAAARSWKS